MVAAHAVTTPQTGATPPSFYGFYPDHFVVCDFGLTQFIPEVPVPFVANERFVPKFLVDRWIYFQVVPFLLKDLLEVW